uniref:mRNA n=1 Tax=Oulactis sp. TaxID=2093647 RepID=A0A4D8XNB5_OULSP|nr:mRNA [Oulactis sp. MM-2018]SZA01509.1 mRNA [Oulactis sp. MM-2018]
MSKVLFLCLVILCATAVFATEYAEGEKKFVRSPRLMKRAWTCVCMNRVGDRWMWRGSCPSGHGYTSSGCHNRSSICCFPRT